MSAQHAYEMGIPRDCCAVCGEGFDAHDDGRAVLAASRVKPGRLNALARERLANAKVLYRAANGFLYAIPYEMQPGQSPRDLYDSTSFPDVCSRVSGARIVMPGPREDWVLVFEREPDPAEVELLARFGDLVPQRPHEWGKLWDGLCPMAKHGLDYEGQACDLCVKR